MFTRKEKIFFSLNLHKIITHRTNVYQFCCIILYSLVKWHTSSNGIVGQIHRRYKATRANASVDVFDPIYNMSKREEMSKVYIFDA